jgi:putative membrane protein
MQQSTIRLITLMSLALGSAAAYAQTPAERPYYLHDTWGWGWGWGHMIFGSLMMVLFWGGIILLIVLAVRWLGAGSAGAAAAPARKTAIEILEERFARGEIDKEEFEERKRHLSE